MLDHFRIDSNPDNRQIGTIRPSFIGILHELNADLMCRDALADIDSKVTRPSVAVGAMMSL